MCTYTKNSARRYIAPTASVKLRDGSPKMARNEVCAHQKYTKLSFQDNFVAVVHLRDCTCAPILLFSSASDGATVEHPIQNRVLVNFAAF